MNPPGWEPVPGGWIAPSECGHHFVHLTGEAPTCEVCLRIATFTTRSESTFTLRSEHERRNQLFYPRGGLDD